MHGYDLMSQCDGILVSYRYIHGSQYFEGEICQRRPDGKLNRRPSRTKREKRRSKSDYQKFLLAGKLRY